MAKTYMQERELVERGLQLRLSIFLMESARYKKQDDDGTRDFTVFSQLFLEATRKDPNLAFFTDTLLHVFSGGDNAIEGAVQYFEMSEAVAKSLVLIWKNVLEVMHIEVPKQALIRWRD